MAGRSFLGFQQEGQVPADGSFGRADAGCEPHAHRRTQALPPLGAISQENVLPAVPIRRLGASLPGRDPDGNGLLYSNLSAGGDTQAWGARPRNVLDEYPSLEDFSSGLRRFQGEIKGILTRGRFLAGIGNAYADEALFEAGVFPFKKRKILSEDDLSRLHDSIPRVLHSAINVLRERMNEDIHVKVRDFLQVHGKGGSPCPRCGGNITTIGANQRLTNYCRQCQPGMLLRN